MERISIYMYGPDEHLKSVLKSRARRNNRSLSAEIVALVKLALEPQGEPYVVHQIEVVRED